MNFWSWVPFCLCSEHNFFLWARLKIVDGKIWLSVEYQRCCLVRVHACEYFFCYHIYFGFKDINITSSTAAVSPMSWGVDRCRSSGWSVESFYLLIVSCVWLFWCWELLMVRWYSFRLCLTLLVDNLRRQVNAASWSTCFHLLFELPLFNFRIHMSQITW
jgi:hypothetical protein